MKKITILIVLLSITTITFGQKKPKIKGNKVVTELNKEILENFNAIEIDDALEVNLTQTGENSYFITTDENLLDIVQFSVKDSILKIYTTNRIVSSKKLEISLNVKEIKHLILKNDAKVEGKGRLTSDKLYLSGYNSSRFDLDIKADDVIITLQRDAGGKIKVKSKNTTIIMNDRTDLKAYVVADKTRVTQTKSSELSLDGDSGFATFNLKDSAKLEAKKMKVSSVDLYTSNSSDVYVYASKNLELYAQGKSNVYVYGNPKVEVKGLTDKSKIIKK
ncbi:GIN domain-containing protein [Aquimarina latercula]|uniref:GIN domain-containing protein n=1 Tax=Aquimarina latercula TaxID=987 RepID=UPI0004008138|nr:DUF2807 domain-containing protein [Aquimarina latercula]